MTNERAIELLNRISDSQFDGPHGDERREALEMAVRALFSQQTVNDSQGLVNDCISRKMAIEAFEPEHHTDWYTPTIIETLEALPSEQLGQRYTNEELMIFQHGISLSLLSKRSAQHWRYDENTATEIKFLERLYEKVSANMRGGQNE